MFLGDENVCFVRFCRVNKVLKERRGCDYGLRY